MSKFFQDDDDEQQEDLQSQVQSTTDQNAQINKVNRNKILIDILGSDDDDEKRIIVTEKDKRYNKLREIVADIKMKMKNLDFVQLLDKYELLNKEIEKGAKFFEKEGGVPRLYIRILCQIEVLQLSQTTEQKKKWGANNSKAFNTLKQRMKKNNINYQKQIDEFIQNQVTTDQSDQEQQELRKQNRKEGDSEPEQKQEESEEEEDDDKYLLQSKDPMVRRRYWLKKRKPTDQQKQPEEEQETKKKNPNKPEEIIDYDVKFDNAQNQEIQIDYGVEAVNKQLEKIVASRGMSKNQVRNIYICEKLIQHFINENLKKTVEILLILINLQIDRAKSIAPFYISRQSWLQIFQNTQLLYSLHREKGVKVDHLSSYSQYESELQTNGEQKFQNTLLLTFQTLENELNRAFQYVDYYTQEYAERISDLYQLIHLSQKLFETYKAKDDVHNGAKLCFKQLEGIYYIPPQVIQKLLDLQQNNKTTASPIQIFGNGDLSQKIEELTLNIYKSNDKENIIKASLYWVYNLALNGKYEQAHETFIKSVSYDQVQGMKTLIQLHYNRALVQLGLAAFRQGLFYEAHIHLADLMSRDKMLKDLLAQNYAKQPEGDVKYNIPYHMSINLETVEFVYFLSAMLLEVPNIHSDPFDEGHKVISRKFRQLYQYYDSQSYNPQPENMRDLIYAASKELGKGDWEKCWEWLLQINLWQKIPNFENVQILIKNKVQEQSLKCYIFTYKQAFANISLEHLESRFKLSIETVTQIIYKMIYYGEIKASLESQETMYLSFSADEASCNQAKRIAGVLVEKLNGLCKINEKLLDSKIGTFAYQQEKDQDQANRQKKKNTTKYKKPVQPQRKRV